MAGDRVELERLPDDEDGGERFRLVFVDTEKATDAPDYVIHRSFPMRPDEVRQLFEGTSYSPDDIEVIFRLARSLPGEAAIGSFRLQAERSGRFSQGEVR